MALVVIDDSRVASMMASAPFRRAFPFLAQAQSQAAKAGRRKCGSCRRKNRAARVDYAGIRRIIGQMPNEKKLQLKKMLGASQVQVDYSNGAGKKIRLRF